MPSYEEVLVEKMRNLHITDTEDLPAGEKKALDMKYKQIKSTVHSTENLDGNRSTTKDNEEPKKLPSDNFRKLGIFPDKKDLHDSNTSVRPNIIYGAYDGVDHYLDVQFRLLREDYFRPLRRGISTYINLKTTKQSTGQLIEGIKIHENVVIIRQYCKRNSEKVFIAGFQVKKFSEIDWESNKRFLPGSLLFFTSDNFQSFSTAIVEKRESDQLKKGHVFIKFRSNQSEDIGSPFKLRFVVVETDAFFVAYRSNLEALQAMNFERFPMADYIVHGRKKSKFPNYIAKSSICDFAPLLENYQERLVSVTCHDDWPSSKDLNLEESQYAALKSAITNEFAIIQGPPGTGKTFIGLKIIQFLSHNSSVLKLGPILVLCYTNHALDQFLSGISKFTDEIVRIGERCANKNVEKYKLSNTSRKRYIKMGNKIKVLSECKVIGATITGAAANKQLLNRIELHTVIVEEAAEILECLTVSSLPLQTEHLILIGDHQQLRPKTNVHEFTTEFNMDVSLFERMVRNDMEFHQLNIQHRMRPPIAALLVPHIYPDLKNDISVQNLDNVLGVNKNVFFLNHDEPERSVADSLSKVNDHEARFVVALCVYFLQQGYKEEEITILATYTAQVSLIQKLLKKSDRGYLCANVRVSSVDGYQGEENEIILLSFVRSNNKKRIGFLTTSNRLCVALSRARKGLFCIGNFSQYAEKSKLWFKIVRTLTAGDRLGTRMSLICKRHSFVTDVCKSWDFGAVRDGGCFVTCRIQLACGHFCQMKCHPEVSHQEYKCMEICNRIICKKKHRCKKLCYEECGDCGKKKCSSGIKKKVPCSQPPR